MTSPGDTAIDAIDGLVDAIEFARERMTLIEDRAVEMRRRRSAGQEQLDILPFEERLVIEALLTETISLLHQASSKLELVDTPASDQVADASAVARDITERDRVDELRFRLAAIVDSSDDAILSKTLDGIILTWNAAAQRLYGYSPEEIVGRSVSVLVPPDRPQEVADILAKLRRGEGVEHFESTRVHRDGHLIPVSLTISPIRDASGHVVAASTIARDITERHRQRHLERVAYRDALTGLGNRLAMDEDMRSIQDRFDRYGNGFCIAMLDIDHFKSFNDSYGHQAGDRILAEVGAAIASEIRPADLAYRYGGDELLIVYPHQSVATTCIGVQRIRHRVEKIASHADFPGPVTLSAGIADARDRERYETIVRRADRALYRAKDAGRNQVCVEPTRCSDGGW